MTWYPTQSHDPDTDPTSLYPILLMLSARLGINFQVIHLTWPEFEPASLGFPNLPTLEWHTFSAILSGHAKSLAYKMLQEVQK